MLFTIAIDAVTNRIKGGAGQETLYADDFTLIAVTMQEQQRKIYGWISEL